MIYRRASAQVAGFGLAVVLMVALSTFETKAQIVISNEKLATTTFAVKEKPTVVRCDIPGCHAAAPILTAIPVTCPAAKGGTCTFHISFDSKVLARILGCHSCYGTLGNIDSYQFLIDSAAPTPGPTDTEGWYIFGRAIESSYRPSRISYPASVVAKVTNSGSQKHVIDVNLGCFDPLNLVGCAAEARMSTLRVDIFQP